jgi:hypothetical protein
MSDSELDELIRVRRARVLRTIDRDVFFTPRGPTAYLTPEDLSIYNRALRRKRNFCKCMLLRMLEAERQDAASPLLAIERSIVAEDSLARVLK